MASNKISHNCEENLDNKCKCKICGEVHHSSISDCKGSGIGRVTTWCTRCGLYDRYWDDTGTTIETGYRSDMPENWKMRWHKCTNHLDKNQKCEICGMSLRDILKNTDKVYDVNESVLLDIAKTDEDSSVREAALRSISIYAISDESVLLDIAKTDEDSSVREAAVRGISDESVLLDIAKTDED